MAHARCASCMVRVRRDDAQAACPSCGGPLEPIAHAEELTGLRAVTAARTGGASLAEHVRATIARNDAARARRLRGHGGGRLS
jgi:hypothetical protein